MAANVRFSNPKTMAKPPGYTNVVEATGPNRLIFIAGQLGLDMDNNWSADRAISARRRSRRSRISSWRWKSAGAGFKDVVKINNYLTDMSHLGIFREVRDEFVNTAAPPASDDRRRFRNWRGRARCSRSRRSRCCRRRRRKPRRSPPPQSGKVKARRRKRK